MRFHFWLLKLSCLVNLRLLARLFVAWLAFAAFGSEAAAQACGPGPVIVNGTSCVVTPGPVIIVNSSAAPGLDARNGGSITAQGITVQLGPGAIPRTFVGAQALIGAAVELGGSTIVTSQAATGQRGVFSDGTGSRVTGTGVAITLGTGTTVSDNLAVLASNGGTVSFIDATVATLGGANGIANHAVTATGTGSAVSFIGGSISTASRGSFGVQASNGGQVTIGGGTSVTTTGVQNAGTTPGTGSHALISTGIGSRIDGADVTLSTSGLLASAARAENGGVIDLRRAVITTNSTASADSDPSSAARVLSGGALSLTDSTIATTGQRGVGLSVQDSGSIATVSKTDISVSGNRANAAFIFDGGRALVSDSILFSSSATAVSVQGAGSRIDLIDSTIRSTGAVGYGVRIGTGASGEITRGSSTTTGRDAPALSVANGVAVANDVDFSTSGDDNAMGVIADGGGDITLNGGSVITTGNSVRLSAYPHGIAARNPGGIVRALGTSIRTEGQTAMGVVADDGGTVLLTNNAITTLGATSIGLYSTVEQSGAQFPAAIVGDGVVVETFGTGAHGAMAVEHFLPAPSVISLENSTVRTHGNLASGLRAITAASIDVGNSVILTDGVGSYGLHVRDNGSEISLVDTTVTTVGVGAHGALAEGGGLVEGVRATIEANGTDSYALYVAGASGLVSNANFDASRLGNLDGPAIAVGGEGNVSLTNTLVTSNSQWLNVGTIAGFRPLIAPDAGLGGVTDPEGLESSPTFTPPAALPVVPGLANVTLSHSEVTGTAFTASGSVSNLIMKDDSLWNMTGNSNLTTLLNDHSLIDFEIPISDPLLLSSYMTLTVGSYVGEDGNFGINTYLGTDGSPSDRLVVDGGVANGTSGLIVKNTGGAGAVTSGNGILVVDAVNGGMTAPGAFYLYAPAVAGPYEYSLYRSSVDGSGPENWYLRSELNPGPGPDPVVPVYRSEVSLYAAIPSMAAIYGRHIIDTLHERVGEEEQLKGRQDLWEKETFNGIWMRAIGHRGHREGSPLGIYEGAPEYDYRFGALQAGMDLYRKEKDGTTDHAGAFLAYGRGVMEVEHNILDRQFEAGSNHLDAFTVGGYWTRFGEKGWYVDGVIQGTWYDVTTQSRRDTVIGFPSQDVGGFGFAASIEAGYPFDLDNGWQLEPQAQLVYQNIRFDDFNDGAAHVLYDDMNSLAGRIGARLARTWEAEEGTATEPAKLATVWGRVNLWHEFTAKAQTDISSEAGFVPFSSDLDETWIEFGIGASRQLGRTTTVYGSVGVSTTFNADTYALNGKVGLRVNW